MATQFTQARSLYRRLLREMPSRSPSILANPSPVQKQIRTDMRLRTGDGSSWENIAAAEQYIQYLKAQRMYTALLDRYNPGAHIDEEERVRLTGRRVGMEMPTEYVRREKG